MTLSITGSSVFIGESLVPGGIEFLPTDMDAMDANGKPTGEKLLIARTPHINAHRNRINAYLLARGETHGSMVMHEDGTAYVVTRGNRTNPQQRFHIPVMEARHSVATVQSIKYNIQFVPDSSLILVDPDFATHPAVNMTWYESASQAVAIEDADPRFRIRMMCNPEYTRFVTWNGKYTETQIKARAHLYQREVTGTASVADETAQRRITPEGFVDPFGNVWIWTDGVKARPAIRVDMDTVARISRGASWLSNPQTNVNGHYAIRPDSYCDDLGVRWVAVAR